VRSAGNVQGSDGGFQGAVGRIKLMAITVVLVHGADYADVMLERFGKVCGWAGTSFALLSFILGFHKSIPGNPEPLYVGVLASSAYPKNSGLLRGCIITGSHQRLAYLSQLQSLSRFRLQLVPGGEAGDYPSVASLRV
jgi:hypothetical protein